MKMRHSVRTLIKLYARDIVLDLFIISAVLLGLSIFLNYFSFEIAHLRLIFTFPITSPGEFPNVIVLLVNLVILFLPTYFLTGSWKEFKEEHLPIITIRQENLILQTLFYFFYLISRSVSIMLPYIIATSILNVFKFSELITYVLMLTFVSLFITITSELIINIFQLNYLIVNLLVFSLSYLMLLINLDYIRVLSPLYMIAMVQNDALSSISYFNIIIFIIVIVLLVWNIRSKDYLEE